MLPTLQTEDPELIRSAQQGDMDAFGVLYQRYFPVVHNRVRYLVPTEDVEDLTQEIFIATLRSLHGFRGDAKFSTWLRTLTNRQIADYYRRRKQPESELDEHIHAPTDPNSGEDVIHLRQALNLLPEKYREVILLRFVENIPFAEIARMTNRSLEGTKSLFRRAVKALNAQVTK